MKRCSDSTVTFSRAAKAMTGSTAYTSGHADRCKPRRTSSATTGRRNLRRSGQGIDTVLPQSGVRPPGAALSNAEQVQSNNASANVLTGNSPNQRAWRGGRAEDPAGAGPTAPGSRGDDLLDRIVRPRLGRRRLPLFAATGSLAITGAQEHGRGRSGARNPNKSKEFIRAQRLAEPHKRPKGS